MTTFVDTTINLNKTLQYIIAISLVILTLLCIFPLDLSIANKLSERAVLIMFAMLGTGLIGLMVSKHRIMYTGMACAAVLCIFLKGESNGSIVFPSKNDISGFDILHLNLSSITDGYEEALDQIIAYDPDFISFQEVTPEWNSFLRQRLSVAYPYNATIVRPDPYGKAIYSKQRIKTKKNLYTSEKPLLAITFTESGRDLSLVSAYLSQSIDKQGRESAKLILDKLSEIVELSTAPLMVVGDFNLTYWSNEISDFRKKTKLKNSRRSISLGSFYIPIDHIFYTDQIQCTEFEEITNDDGHLGIRGSYQLSLIN